MPFLSGKEGDNEHLGSESASSSCYQSAVISGATPTDPTDWCEKAACGRPRRSPDLPHNGAHCQPRLTPAPTPAGHRGRHCAHWASEFPANEGKNGRDRRFAENSRGQVRLGGTAGARSAVRLQRAMKCNYHLKNLTARYISARIQRFLNAEVLASCS